MYNFIKTLFGIPSNDTNQEPRTTVVLNENNYENDRPSERYIDNKDEDNERNIFRHFDTNMRVFGPTIFGDPGEIHKYLDGLFDEMQKKIDLFGFNSQNSIIWDDQSNNFFSSSSHENPQSETKSLRDSFLKSDHNTNIRKRDINLDSNLMAEEFDNIFNSRSDMSQNISSIVTTPQNSYSKSVYIRTIRHPDGVDNTGNEETTITHDNNSPYNKSPNDYPLSTSDDASSIFRKFFPF
ncbi:conserved hypothetical protein [Pediculus humanus corporis]|uniref:Uncharacterized protein n=1 Tax=Pediculus humanus subsp. corporis TaxID=121224 RepID=E0VJS4_PEDHC|nr:uncharacterized protein Phum_PHUM249640 [Pediculus humanus corporis]EEB13630.1 conserved hypothetical protein [Pediculus humanus corporis]